MPRRVAKLSILFFFIFLASGFTARAEEQLPTPTATYQFGQSIIFQTTFQPSQPIQYALVYFNEEGNARTTVKPARITTDDGITYKLDYQFDVNEQSLRAFSKINFYFEVGYPSNQTITGPSGQMDYFDNRFAWRNKKEGVFSVNWYRGDIPFAQKALDVAQNGLQRIQALLPIDMPDPIDIFIYPNSEEMQEALVLAHSNWVAGNADPDLGVIVVSLPPGPEQQLLTEQRIPHELMHVLLYRSIGTAYSNLPAWLNEGLASLAELFPNPDYEVLLDSAFQKDKLIPIATLCKNFPVDASGTLLGYAESASFVTYLHTRYGADRLQALVDQTVDGSDCENGFQNALQIGLYQADQEWRQERFGAKANQIAINELLPWLALLFAVLVAPIGIMIVWLRRHPKQSGPTTPDR
jgi:hypothetical protein